MGRKAITNEVFVERMSIINPNIILLTKYIRRTQKIKCKCKIDGYEWDALPSHLLNGSGCPVCSNRVIIHGINDVATTHPNFIIYFKNKGY